MPKQLVAARMDHPDRAVSRYQWLGTLAVSWEIN